MITWAPPLMALAKTETAASPEREVVVSVTPAVVSVFSTTRPRPGKCL